MFKITKTCPHHGRYKVSMFSKDKSCPLCAAEIKALEEENKKLLEQRKKIRSMKVPLSNEALDNIVTAKPNSGKSRIYNVRKETKPDDSDVNDILLSTAALFAVPESSSYSYSSSSYSSPAPEPSFSTDDSVDAGGGSFGGAGASSSWDNSSYSSSSSSYDNSGSSSYDSSSSSSSYDSSSSSSDSGSW